MKILFINKFFFLNGGSETVFFQEREFLKNIGHSVIDFSMQHPNNYPSIYSKYFVSNIDYHDKQGGYIKNVTKTFKTTRDFVYNREALNKIKKLISIEKPQIAHLHNIYHQITPAIIPVLKNAGIKVILTLHDFKLLCPAYYMLNKNNICNACAGKHFYHATLNRCQEGDLSKSMLLSLEAYWHKYFKNYEMVDLFLSPSRFMAHMMGQYRVDEKKIVVLHNGNDISKYKLSTIDSDYIIYFGRISKVKGIDTLLMAYKDQKIKIPLKIVGTGPDKERLQTQYPDVEFVGYRSGSELNQLIAEASFSVVPSEWYENCSMSILESMAYGKPVIGSNIGGIPEQIEDGKSGYLFEPGNTHDLGDKMSRLIENKPLRREMGEASRRIIEHKYTLNEHCEKLVHIYEELINSK
jgi:glycosyltransferase involved in cell wall biosynthesis